MEAAKIPLMLLLGSVCCLLAFEPSSATSDSGPSGEVIRQAVGLGLKPNDLTKLWSTRQPVEVVKQDEGGRPYTVTYTITPELDRIIEVHTQPQPQPQLEMRPKTEPQQERQPEPQSKQKPEPQSTQKPELQPESQSKQKPEPQPEPQSETQSEPQSETQPKPQSETQPSPGWNYIPNRPTFQLDKLPFGGQATTFKSNWQGGLAWPNFEIRSAVAPMMNNEEGSSVTRMHSVSIPVAGGLPSSGWPSTNVPSFFGQSLWPFHNPFLPLDAQGKPTYVTSANPVAQPEPQPPSRPTFDLDTLPPLPTVASTVGKTRVINADVGLLPHFRIYTSHRSERPPFGREGPQLWNNCISQQDLQKASGQDGSIDSSIESYLARVNLTPADILAHNGEFIKTIVDQSGRVLSVKYVLSDVKGEGKDQGKRPEYEIKRR